MANKREIFLRRGGLKKLSDLSGIAPGVCSGYLKGWYDEQNWEVKEKAERVRNIALEQCGGFYPTSE